jgi:hypothetical protein
MVVEADLGPAVDGVGSAGDDEVGAVKRSVGFDGRLRPTARRNEALGFAGTEIDLRRFR